LPFSKNPFAPKAFGLAGDSESELEESASS
jgi:hypothetical protein